MRYSIIYLIDSIKLSQSSSTVQVIHKIDVLHKNYNFKSILTFFRRKNTHNKYKKCRSQIYVFRNLVIIYLTNGFIVTDIAWKSICSFTVRILQTVSNIIHKHRSGIDVWTQQIWWRSHANWNVDPTCHAHSRCS